MLGDSVDWEGAALTGRESSGGSTGLANWTGDRQGDLPTGGGFLQAASPVLDRSSAQTRSTEGKQLLPDIPGVRY